MGYDDVLPHLGSFGPYQRRIFFLVCLPAISCAFHKLAGVFLLAKPDHRCLLPFEADNATFVSDPDFPPNMTYPWDAVNSKWSTCERLQANFTSQYFQAGIPANHSVSCEKWVYDDTMYVSSTVTEWDLVCSKSWLSATSDALFMVGVLLGSIIFGHMSDKLGRKPIFFASLVIQVIFGVLAGIAPEYLTYTISRIVVGATTSGVFLVAYVLAMEMVGPSWRLFAGTIMMMFFSVGYMLTAAFAYFFPGWRALQIALTLPGLLFLCYWWFIPESARWLLSKRRKEDAIANIQKAAAENKVTIPTEVLDNLIEPETKEDIDKPAPSLFDLFKYPNLRKKSLLIFFDWFVNSGTYYGLSWNTNNLGGNILLNFVISGAVEIPAYTFLLLTLNRWGRKTILCGCMLMAGTMLLLTMAVPEDKNWLIILLAMLGKLAITASYGTIYIFSAEQFPTVIRNVGLGAASMVARFGGILAPYINFLGDIWKPFPMIIFGAMAFAGGLLSLFLPETLNQTLPDTVAEGERFGLKKNKDLDMGNSEEMVELKHHTNGDVRKSEEA
ncbi:organic cation transporter protein-like [Phlebotomus papatasi]|uniref:organic cation transporter protein-like n=1 Tax=Phlebotomus papatasi TaxID=29031 RepID=UPI00248421C5|nr:organic cation transporter protein-like [Phlebotomus papatasi]